MNILTSPVNVIALSKVLRDENISEARDCLDEGDYAIDAQLRLFGSMSVGEGYTSRIVAKADTWGLLAVALSKLNGVTIDKLLREYFAREGTQSDPATLGKMLSEEATAAIEAIKGRTAQLCRGRVTPRVSCEIANNRSGSVDVSKGKVKRVASAG